MSMIQVIKGIGQPAQKSMSLDPATYRGGLNEMFFWDDKGTEHRFNYTGHLSCRKAYVKCPPLAAIINRKAQCHINGKTWVLNSSGKTKGKESQNEAAKKIRALFAKPNPLQSGKQFEAQQKIYIQTFGFCIVLPILPAGFTEITDATSLWNIPPYMIDIEETSKLFYQTALSGIVKTIKLKYRNTITELPLDQIGIFRDITPSFDTLVFPESRVVSLEMPINNIIAALESQNEVISYAGSQGIISPDSSTGQYAGIPLSQGDKKELQDDFRRQYGIRKGQFRYIISPAAIKWQSMGTDPKKLMLIETVQEGTKSICDGYNYPPHLLGIIDPTFNNQNAAEKGLYNNAIIPEADSISEEWNNFFKTERFGIQIEKDFSHLPILQENRGEMATARKTLNEALKMEWEQGLITLDEWLIELGKDPLPDGLGQFRIMDQEKNKNVPLALVLGQTGIQSLIDVLTATGLDPSARQSVLEICFGISSADAARMTTAPSTVELPGSTTETEPITTTE